MTDLVSQSYPTNSPFTSRPDWRPTQGKPGSHIEDMKAHALDRSASATASAIRVRRADGVQRGYGGRVLPRLNDWLVKEWLDRDSGARVRS